jgi:hypothetical protein
LPDYTAKYTYPVGCRMRVLGDVRLLKSEAEKRIEEILVQVWGEVKKE